MKRYPFIRDRCPQEQGVGCFFGGLSVEETAEALQISAVRDV